MPRCKSCTKTTGELPLKPGFCFIGNTCYDNGYPKIGTGLDNQCNTCQWTVNPAVWSPLPSSTVCNDKQANTHTDRCSVQGADATCIGTGYTCDLPQCQVSHKGAGCVCGSTCGAHDLFAENPSDSNRRLRFCSTKGRVQAEPKRRRVYRRQPVRLLHWGNMLRASCSASHQPVLRVQPRRVHLQVDCARGWLHM